MQNRNWVLRARKVGCVFPDYDVAQNGAQPDDHVLRGVFVDSVEILPGEVTAILGSSGSGKSSLLGLLTGLRRLNTEIQSESMLDYCDKHGRMHSLVSGGKPPAGEIAFVFQEPQLIKAIPTRLNAEMGGRIAGHSGTPKVAAELCRQFGVDPQMDLLSETLSGGQAQRIAVIRALAMKPRLIVCDEPTSSLDKNNAIAVLEGVTAWAKATGCAVLWVTHDRSRAAQFADRLLVLGGGRVFGDHSTRRGFVIEGQDIEQKKVLVDHYADQVLMLPPLTQNELTQSLNEPAAAEKAHFWNYHGEPDRQALNPIRSVGSWLGLRKFLLSTAFNEVASGFNRERLANSSLRRAVLWGFVSVASRPLTMVLLLGLFVFYSVWTSYFVTQKRFQEELAAPGISHFTIATLRGSDLTLLQPDLKKLEDLLAARTASAGGSQISEPQVFGRREEHLQKFWFPKNTKSETCSEYPIDVPFTERLQVFRKTEPLFRNVKLTQLTDGAKTVMLDQSPEEGVILTRQFIEDFGIEALDEICVDIFGPSGIQIIGVTDKLPGGGERVFPLGMTERAYTKAFVANEPPAFKDRDGNLKFPEYARAAVYFELSYVDKLVCSFDGVEHPDCAAYEADTLSGYKVNSSVLEQVNGILKTYGGATTAYLVLGLAFALAIGISCALAISSFVYQNEKSIAVMKAFGFKFGHVFLLIVTQIAVLLLFASLGFAGLAVVFEFLGVKWVANTFSLRPEWLAFNVSKFLIALSVLTVISMVVANVVLGLWWWKNRFLGETLQEI